ncbi:uncharacterized protein LOC124355867 [Homalodisca vitripennis]|uniref:uncharacterized protein LOC124355867 n=1 Tax=Homalodisca vitripennis TaxID=197043 RepID=UPI001EEC8E90|nr:uncharacterized protein LOC124355867 [Homalodisca vitripennis]
MSKVDIDYLASEQVVWRFEPCSVNRRSSLRLESKANEGTLSLEDVMKSINELRSDHKVSMRDFNESYELLNNKLDDNTDALKENTAKMREYLEIIDSLKRENKKLKEKVQLLETKVEYMEQYSRRNCIEIQGVPSSDDEVLDSVKKVGQALGMEITESMVDACHLLGKRPNATDPPGIIVKFVRRIDAESLLTKRRGKKLSTRHLGLSTDSPVYVNESLTPERRRLFAMARNIRSDKNYKWLWVRGGKIFLRTSEENQLYL